VTQCSFLCGFSFESIVHLDVPPGTPPALSSWFFASLALCVMCAVYTVVCGSCLIVLGHQLALLGADGGSLEEAVVHMRKRRASLFGAGFAALFFLLSAGAALAWIKMGPVAVFVSTGFAVTAFITMSSVTSMFCSLATKPLVTGATKFYTPEGYFDLAHIQPNVGHRDLLASTKKAAEVV